MPEAAPRYRMLQIELCVSYIRLEVEQQSKVKEFPTCDESNLASVLHDNLGGKERGLTRASS